MKKIGFLGGTYDPIHNGHVEIAKIAADRLCLDSVVFVPAGIPPHKEGSYKKSSMHRLNMVRLAALQDERFAVSDYEINKEGTSYSYITMEHFKNVYMDEELYFIMGDEAFAQLETWKNPDRLRRAAKLVVVNRENIKLPEDVISVQFPPIEISSTMIRQKIKNGENVEKFLPQNVYEYILENNLYKG